MSRSSGTYTAPTSGWKPAVEGSVIDSSDWNTLVDDLEAAVTETVYTGGLGATDNALVRTDGTDTKKAQGATPTISDTGVIVGVATFILTGYTIGTLPVGAEGQIAYASDWDKNGGASTGSLVFFDGEAWRGVDTGATTGTAPENTVLPVISGTLTAGQTLTTTTGTWLYSPTSYTYQWKDDGVAISGATNSTYVLTSAEAGGAITVTVTATNASGSTAATSAGVGPVIDATDPSFANVVLLLGFEDADGSTSTTDESPTTPHTFTFNGNAQTDTAQKKFGASSLLLDGTGDYLAVADNADWEFPGDFTIEAWVRLNAVGSVQTIISDWTPSIGVMGWTFDITAANKLRFHGYDGFASYIAQSSSSLTTGQWYHVAADRSGSTVRVYIDGVFEGAVSDSTTSYAPNQACEIGRRSADNVDLFNGWIDELRVTKGTARYATGASFTVPADRFPRQ
jgi:hypothetical protein